jgi:hypothetical protein
MGCGVLHGAPPTLARELGQAVPVDGAPPVQVHAKRSRMATPLWLLLTHANFRLKVVPGAVAPVRMRARVHARPPGNQRQFEILSSMLINFYGSP